MKIYLTLDAQGRILGWSSTRGSEDEVELDVADNHEVLTTTFKYSYIGGQLTTDGNYLLNRARYKKDLELRASCERAIMGHFSADISIGTYEFSYDEKAQTRFNGIGVMFTKGLVTEAPWTAYQNGIRTRITLSEADFDIVSVAALQHENNNVIKYNDLLATLNSTPLDQIDSIVW